MTEILIPLYKPQPDLDDLKSLDQVFRVLGTWPIVWVCPKSLDLSAYAHYPAIRTERFDDTFFEGIPGYNRLMLSTEFYQRFSADYLLIYQTDAYVFQDSLQDWVDRGYDYIGAPWIRSRENIPFAKKLWDTTLANIGKIFNQNKNYQKDKSLLYNRVGNGGLSLRNRKAHIRVLEKLKDGVEIYLRPENQSNFYAEDVFFSIEPLRQGIDFKIPDWKEALGFAIENKQEKAFRILDGKLPFGCHRWNKEKRFWKNYIHQ